MTEVTERPTCGAISTKPIVWGFPSAHDPMLPPGRGAAHLHRGPARGGCLAACGYQFGESPAAASSHELCARCLEFSTGLTAEYVPCCAHRSPER